MDDEKTVFVSGYFNALHIGHMRLLEYAGSLGEKLIVGLYTDDSEDATEAYSQRLKYIRMLSVVDEVVEINNNLSEVIEAERPDYIVKGSEFRNKVNIEEDIVDKMGGKLIFYSGDPASSEELKSHENQHVIESIVFPKEFLSRHKIAQDTISYIKNFDKLKVAVFGDIIVDEYIECHPLGMSQEDPALVISPKKKTVFLGGAGIVASHVKALGAAVEFFSLVGDDDYTEFVDDKLNEYNVEHRVISDESRQTTVKQRYRVNGKTLLRVNHVNAHDIDKEFENNILDEVRERADEFDVFIFSDFSYGMLSESLVSSLIKIGEENNIFMAADSQTSSQTGELSKFKGVNLITPTEHEVRSCFNDRKQGLTVLVDRLYEEFDIDKIMVTLASEGAFIQEKVGAGSGIRTDQIPALNLHPVDVAGAGDAFLVAATLAMKSGASIWEASYLGSIVSAIQVNRIGNVPVTNKEISELNYS